MKIVVAIDSLELNGGSTMFMEMVCAFRKYCPNTEIVPIVISKSGYYGRQSLVSNDFISSYGLEKIKSITYEHFEDNKKNICDKCDVFLHHRLSCTKPLHVECPYVVVNHTVQSPKRISKFSHADAMVSVSGNIHRYTRKYMDSVFILNGTENDYIKSLPSRNLDGDFISGACQRIVGSKVRADTLKFMSSLSIPGVNKYRHYFVGPNEDKILSAYKNIKHVEKVFDRRHKMSFIKSLDVYLYDTNIKEGASMSMLEALACGVPVVCRSRGGNADIVSHKINGFFFESYSDLNSIMNKLSSSKHMKKIKKTLYEDFENRLHIRHMINKYMNVFRKLA